MKRQPAVLTILVLSLAAGVLAGGTVGCAGTGVDSSGAELSEMEKARLLFEKGRYDSVILLLTQYLSENPGNRFADEATFLTGRSYYEEGSYLEAEDRFRKVQRDFPESEFAPMVSYYLGLAILSQSRKAELDQTESRAAMAQLTSFLSRYPDHELAERAKGHINDIQEKLAEKDFKNAKGYFKRRQYKAAIFYFEKKVISRYPDTSWAMWSKYELYRLNWKLHRKRDDQEDLKTAVSWAQKLLEDHPDFERAGEVRGFLEEHSDALSADSTSSLGSP